MKTLYVIRKKISANIETPSQRTIVIIIIDLLKLKQVEIDKR